MKKQFLVFLILMISMEFVSCTSDHHQTYVLYPNPITGSSGLTGRIVIEEFNEKEIGFKIWISPSKEMWLDYIILDREKNLISEESFYHEVRAGYTRKLRAREGFKFRKGEEYTLHIGFKLPISHPSHDRFQLLYSCKLVL